MLVVPKRAPLDHDVVAGDHQQEALARPAIPQHAAQRLGEGRALARRHRHRLAAQAIERGQHLRIARALDRALAADHAQGARGVVHVDANERGQGGGAAVGIAVGVADDVHSTLSSHARLRLSRKNFRSGRSG
jgi:hypothetical protein